MVTGDTEITLDDGTTAPAGKLGAGEEILVWDKGWRTGPITAVDQGVEVKPAVYIEYLIDDTDQHHLVVTSGQPMVTSEGIVTARNIVAGDILLTDDSTARVLAVSMGVTDGRVYGLELDGPEASSIEGHAFLAGGVRIGDLAAESEIERVEHDPANVARELPRAWADDFADNLADSLRVKHSSARSDKERFAESRALSAPHARDRAMLQAHLDCLTERASRLEARSPRGLWQGKSPTSTCPRPDAFAVTDAAEVTANGHIHLTVTCPQHYSATEVQVTAEGDAGRAHALRLTPRSLHVGSATASPGSELRAAATCRHVT